MKRKILLILGLVTISVGATVPYKFGLAGYTFRQKTLDESLAILQRVDVHYLCVKDFHLKYNADDATIAAFKEKCAAKGVIPYALGPLYTKNAAEARAYFEFAKRFGTKLIIGVPYEMGGNDGRQRVASRQQLEVINELVKEFDIRYAIHNHGPQMAELFPSVSAGWELVKDLDSRIGFCLDVGWEYGCGNDPVATIHKFGSRIYDLHFKNFKLDRPNGFAIPLSRGKIDYVKVMKALVDIGYTGVCSLEYERDFNDNLAPIAECVGYFRGVADTLPSKTVLRPVPAMANTLSAAEQAAGWKLLFDGKRLPTDTFVGVKGGCKAFPDKGWYVQAGALTMRPINGIAPDGRWFPLPPEDVKLGGGGDIVTIEKFRDFEFVFDFRLTSAANSGVKYFVDENLNGGTAEEYQILENGHPDADKGKDGNRRVASLYDIIPAHADAVLKGVGEWNTGRILAQGNHVEHWLNGVKVVTYERGTPAFRAAVAKSKYAKWGKTASGEMQPWGEIVEGRLLLQDHSDSTVSFCNLKVRVIK